MNRTIVQFRKTRSGVPKGTRLNDLYEIETQIASGGMGEIYRGYQIETGHPVAIKMIKQEFADNESVLALFRKEAHALNELHHDAIVRYYVFTVDPTLGRPYLAMEFVDGEALSDLLRSRALNFDEVNDLRRRIAEGLQAAHDKGIVHRDIAPDNIILPGGDVRRAKIIDFGIARSSKLGQATVIGDGFAGKYNYVSPEQLGMFGANVTHRSDIYSLGLVLAEASLGRALDMSGSQADVVQKRFKLPDLSPIDGRLRPLLERMLQPEPDKRPLSMTAIAHWQGKAMPRRPGRRSWLAAGLGSALLALGSGAWLFVPSFFPADRVERGQADRIVPDEPHPMTPDERIARIADYLRYYEGGDCFHVAPVDIGETSALVTTYSDFKQSVKGFEADFLTVNGFEAKVTDIRISRAQCAVMPLLHRLDPDPDPHFVIALEKGGSRRGEPLRARFSGLGGRALYVLTMNEEGDIRNVGAFLRQNDDAPMPETIIDEKAGLQPRTLLLAFATTQPVQAFTPSAESHTQPLLDAIASEIGRNGTKVAVALQVIDAK